MLLYNLSEKGNRTMYEYLYECIREDILSGRLTRGEKLPSKRSFAKYHAISVKTVENAYELLLAEGFVVSREKSGYFVEEVKTPSPVYSVQEVPLRQEEQYLADFTINNTVYERFPFSQWARVMREILTEQDAELLKTVPFQGTMELRCAIAGHLYHFRGMSVSPEQIIVGAGTEYLYGQLLQLLGRGHRYALEDPGYNKIARIYENYGMDWSYVSYEEEGIHLEELKESGADVIHVSPGHHFPLGSVMPPARRRELLSWASEQPDRYIIEDDYDCEFQYAGRPVPTMQSMDTNHRVIYINTFSKTLAPSIRISYMVLPVKLMERYRAGMNFYSCTVSGFEQYALARFIDRGYFERHLNRMRRYYREHRNRMLEALKRNRLFPLADVKENQAGTHFLLKIDTTMNDIQLKWAAAKAGIKIACLSEYCHKNREAYAHTIVLNYSDMSEEVLQKAMGRLAEILWEDAHGGEWFL